MQGSAFLSGICTQKSLANKRSHMAQMPQNVLKSYVSSIRQSIKNWKYCFCWSFIGFPIIKSKAACSFLKIKKKTFL